MARPTPVLPEVGSTITPPGLSSPLFSAASMMRSAMRSLEEPPGLKYSTLAAMVALMPSATWLRRMSGVLPMSSAVLLWMVMTFPLGLCGFGDSVGMRSQEAASSCAAVETGPVGIFALVRGSPYTVTVCRMPKIGDHADTLRESGKSKFWRPRRTFWNVLSQVMRR